MKKVVERSADAEKQEGSAKDGERRQVLEIRHQAHYTGDGKKDDDIYSRIHFDTGEKFDYLRNIEHEAPC